MLLFNQGKHQSAAFVPPKPEPLRSADFPPRTNPAIPLADCVAIWPNRFRAASDSFPLFGELSRSSPRALGNSAPSSSDLKSFPPSRPPLLLRYAINQPIAEARASPLSYSSFVFSPHNSTRFPSLLVCLDGFLLVVAEK